MSSPVTFQELADLFYGFVGDSEANQDFFTTTQVEFYANKALQSINEEAEYYEYLEPFVTVSGTSEYILNETGATALNDRSGNTTLSLSRLEVDDERIYPITQSELRRHDQDYQSRSGEPYWYYRDEIQVDEEFRIGLWREPNAVFSCMAYLVIVPRALSFNEASLNVQIPGWAMGAMLYSMLADAYSTAGKLHNRKTAKYFRVMYVDIVDRLKARSFGKLPIRQVFGESGRRKRFSVHSLIPSTGIPEP